MMQMSIISGGQEEIRSPGGPELPDPRADPLELLQAGNVVVGIRADRPVDAEESFHFGDPPGEPVGERVQDCLRVHGHVLGVTLKPEGKRQIGHCGEGTVVGGAEVGSSPGGCH